MPLTSNYKAHPVHAHLGGDFFDAVKPAEFPQKILRFQNLEWAEKIGMEKLTDEEWLSYFAEFKPLPGNLPQPLALRYHGHQFQNYNPDIGDGRGFLYAQIKEPHPPYRILDLATKGSGQTPYSRSGDGRLTLKGAVREILATEMLEALGVNTSKTFSVIETGEDLIRHDEPSPTRSAVLVRLSHSHIRFGSFQRLAFFEQIENIQKLVDHSCTHYYPELLGLPPDQRCLMFFKQIVQRSAALCAQWMVAGFVHGVLNTDNMVITGESFDYGPYRFLPSYDPHFTAAYFDHQGLYAYARQPESVYWNLHQLGHSLSFAQAEMNDYIDIIQTEFSPTLDQVLLDRFLKRLNLKPAGIDQDRELLKTSFDFLRHSQAGYDDFFFDFNGGLISLEFARSSKTKEMYRGDHFEAFLKKLGDYNIANKNLLSELRKNWMTPESLLIDEIESIWSQIEQKDDWSQLERKIQSLRAWKQLWSQQWNQAYKASSGTSSS